MNRQTFLFKDYLRLEVGERPATGLPNLVKNPHGHRGAWGWVTPPADPLITASTLTGSILGTDDWASAVAYLEFVATGPSGTLAYFTSEKAPCAPGQYAIGETKLRATIAAGRSAEISVEFYDKTGARIGTKAGAVSIPAGSGTGSIWRSTASVAPALTTHVAMRIDAAGATTGARSLRVSHNALVVGASSAALALWSYVEPYTWTDILLPSHDIEVVKGGLSLCTMTVALRSTTLDPATATLLRPGNPVRLLARTGSNAGVIDAGVGNPIFWGDIKYPKVNYDLTQADPTKRTLITFNAVDPSARLANLKQPIGVATVNDLKYLVEGCGVPFNVNGSGGLIPGAATRASTNENASVLDQIAMTRDTNRAHAWVNNFGVLEVWDNASIPTTVLATFSEADYKHDIDIDYDTARCINVVTVKVQTLDAAGAPLEVVYGPYSDSASVTQWGPLGEEFTVIGMTQAQAETFAAAVLAANATPAVRCNGLRFPITTLADFSNVAPVWHNRVHLDLYDRVTVNNTRAGLAQTLRVSTIKHTIRPDKWTVDLGFASTSGASMPSPAPAVTSTRAFPDVPWTAVTFLNGWTNLAAWAPVRYCRRNGIVYIEGDGVPGTNGVAAFTLPAGFRNTVRDIKQGNTNSTSLSAGRFDVMPNGDVIPQGAVTWLGFSCSYPADQ